MKIFMHKICQSFSQGDLSILVTCRRMAWYRHRCNVESTLFNVDVASCPGRVSGCAGSLWETELFSSCRFKLVANYCKLSTLNNDK